MQSLKLHTGYLSKNTIHIFKSGYYDKSVGTPFHAFPPHYTPTPTVIYFIDVKFCFQARSQLRVIRNNTLEFRDSLSSSSKPPSFP